MTNIPLINLRIECRRIYDFWLSKKMEVALSEDEIVSLNTGSMRITAGPVDLITVTLQRCFLGLEAYVQSAARHAYVKSVSNGDYDWQTFPYAHQIKNERRLAAQLYKCLPRLIDENITLEVRDNSLYRWLLCFYRDVRNPIFHGRQIQSAEVDSLQTIAINIASTYRWIDSWYEPHRAFSPMKLNPDIFHFPDPSLSC